MNPEQGLILDPTGKPTVSQKYAACPKCGRPPTARVPSASFGTDIYLICPCGNDFNKELKWESVIS